MTDPQRPRTEAGRADTIAERFLDDWQRDPDSDVSILARQYLRLREAKAATLAEPAGLPLTFAEFAATNRERCESPDGFGHPLSGWSTSDWFLAAAGEFGEAANKAKKLNRVRDGIPGNTETEDELRTGLADEIADTVIYLDLLTQSLGFDLATVVASKFNRTSEKIGAPHRV